MCNTIMYNKLTLCSLMRFVTEKKHEHVKYKNNPGSKLSEQLPNEIISTDPLPISKHQYTSAAFYIMIIVVNEIGNISGLFTSFIQ